MSVQYKWIKVKPLRIIWEKSADKEFRNVTNIV